MKGYQCIFMENIRYFLLKKLNKHLLLILIRAYRSRWLKFKYKPSSPLIIGHENFSNYVQKALFVLENKDPYGFNLVNRYIRFISESPNEKIQGFIIGAVFIFGGWASLHQWPHERFCGYLVRVAVQTRILKGFGILKMLSLDKKCRIVALSSELKSLQRLGCSDFYLDEQQRAIEALTEAMQEEKDKRKGKN